MGRPLIIIPARFASERLKGKMLLNETGKPLIQHTWEACCNVQDADVVIATDHPAIEQAAQSFGATVVMTNPDHQSGSARVAEAAMGREASVIVNCQGDEPEVEPHAISKLIEGHRKATADKRPAFLSTLACPFPRDLDADNPNCVKVVTTDRGQPIEDALYFSRSPIPFPRTRPHQAKLHIGLYAFSTHTLRQFIAMPASSLETTESLEQLRVLEAGHRVAVIMVDRAAPGIDTRDDYNAFVTRYRNRGLAAT